MSQDPIYILLAQRAEHYDQADNADQAARFYRIAGEQAHRYNKIGTALDVSHIQMARYMGAADHAMRQAMSAHLESCEPTVKRYYARDEPSLTRRSRIS